MVNCSLILKVALAYARASDTCSCSSTGRVRCFERRGCGLESCQDFQFGVRRQAERDAALDRSSKSAVLTLNPKRRRRFALPAHSKNAEVM